MGISGYSGSGKTTLIEKALPELKRQGLSVGVLKHTHHMLALDTEGKDTDRFFRAGADFVAGRDDLQLFCRVSQPGGDLQDALSRFPHGLDLILVEGYKGTDISKVWLETNAPPREAGEKRKPEDTGDQGPAENHIVLYRDDPEYLGHFLQYIRAELVRFHSARQVMAGLLIGGKSSRMGSPKTMLGIGGGTLAERMAGILSSVASRTVLLGAAEIAETLREADRLPDVTETVGPLAGMLSAFRWAPLSSWIISSVDMPLMHEGAWQWLLGHRRPGVWAVMPQLQGSEIVEAAGACYEPEIFDFIGSLAQKGGSRLQMIAAHPKVIKPVIPAHLEEAWKNVNTPEDWEKALAALNV